MRGKGETAMGRACFGRGKSAFGLVLFVGIFFALLPGGPSWGGEAERAKKDSLRQAQACLNTLEAFLKAPKKEGPPIRCEIPVVITEAEMSQILKQSFDFASLPERARRGVAWFSSGMAKRLVNARAARCRLTVQLERAPLADALAKGTATLTLSDLPVTCEVTTVARETVTVRFAFRPEVELKDGCVTRFSPNMGQIQAPCRICWPYNLSRLYLTTKMVSLWINHVGEGFARVVNGMLRNGCL